MDKHEFAIFYARTRHLVRSAAIMACGDRADTEEAVQAAYLAAMHDWERLRSHATPEEWIVRTAMRHLGNSTPSQTRVTELALDFTTPALFTPDETAEACDTLTALSTLPLMLRVTMILCHRGHPHEEIAATTETPASMVTDRASAARAALRSALGAGGSPDAPVEAVRLDAALTRTERWLHTALESEPYADDKIRDAIFEQTAV